MRSRVPIRGGTGKSILTGQSQTVVQQTIVQQVAKGGTSGVGTVASTIWPLIQQIPVNVVDIAALATPGLVVDTGSHIIARTLAVNAPLTIADPTGAGGNPTISLTTAALTKTDDTNVTLTLGGTPASALVAAVSLTLGWAGQLSVARGGSGAATLTGYLKGNGTSPFTANATIPATDITGLATVATTGAYSDLSGTPTIPADISGLTYVTGSDETADAPNSLQILAGTNVTFDTSTPNKLTINATGGGGGSGTVTSVDMTVPSILSVSGNPITTSGTLALTLATQSANKVFAGPTTGSAATPTFRSLVAADIPITPAALTKTDDTNVTLTLGGTPATALLQAASITLGWTGTLAVARGGSGAATLTGYLKGNGTSAFTASATIPYTDLTGTPTIPTGANPTASVGLTAVNGTATTFLRSDGAPALSQSISPTWSGNHTFATGWTVTGALGIGPSSSMSAEFGGGQASIYSLGANSSTIGGFRISLRSSGFGTANNLLSSTQSGTAITGVIIGDASALPTITLNGPTVIPAPASGVALTVTGLAGAFAAFFDTVAIGVVGGIKVSNRGSGAGTLCRVQLNDSVADLGYLEGDANGSIVSLKAVNRNNALDFWTGSAGGAQRLKISNTGILTGGGQVAGALVDMTPDASSFTGTLTGMTTTVTTTCHWSRNGNQVILEFDASTGTSNANTFTLTGIPASLQPARTQLVSAPEGGLTTATGGLAIQTAAQLTAASGTVTFWNGGSATGWATTGSKGIANAFSIPYLLN